MQRYLEKADVLIETLPYIRKFNPEIVLIKCGGSAMENEEFRYCVMQDIALLRLVGLKPIIVHNGGKDISKMCEKLGVKSEFDDGLRVNDQATTEVTSMVLNYINRNLVRDLQNLGVKAIGLCDKDGGLLEYVQRDENLGLVGEIQKVNSSVLQNPLEKNFLSIVTPIGVGENFNTYNINTDDVVCAIAKTSGAEEPALLTDTAGFYENFEDKNSLISKISITQAEVLVDKIQGGMHVRLKSCIDTYENGIKEMHILDGRVKYSLLLEFLIDEGIGTLAG